MLTGSKYVTRKVQAEILPFLQNILWYMIATIEITKKDKLQVFYLDKTSKDSKSKLKILHTLEQPISQGNLLVVLQFSKATKKEPNINDCIP
jgi:hypothetical protein